MKVFVLMCVLALAALSAADEEPTPVAQHSSRGCIYILGRCVRECEEGTHAYALGCGYRTPEPTCEEPHPEPETSMLCDYSACYCDQPTVRDTASGRCVPPDQCPQHQPQPDQA
ncbi:hypothetical protein NE865_02129 [Phthorimaea operculella]|nr:hypothetical protein NE865_02129 [Phthorimaea operculella]